MVVPRLIERKRDGAALGGDEWRELISHYAAGRVPDYQMAALCMAVVFRGLEPAELVALTDAMRDSGASLPRGTGTLPRIDKHSTGGVGDTTSLILAPLLAAQAGVGLLRVHDVAATVSALEAAGLRADRTDGRSTEGVDLEPMEANRWP